MAATAIGVMGLLGSATASFVCAVADVDGQLISSGTGGAVFSCTTNAPLLTASLNGQGDCVFAVTANAPILGATASLTGSVTLSLSAIADILPLDDQSPLRDAAASFALTAHLVPYAIGMMTGSTVGDAGTLTADMVASAVWDAIDAAYNDPGTMGGKMNAAASAGDPWVSAMPGSYPAGSAGGALYTLVQVLRNRREISMVDGWWTLIVYDDDGAIPILVKKLTDADGNNISDLPAGSLAAELASSV